MLPAPILVFDVNETLLDLESLSPLFERIFGDARVMREWFAQVILYSQSLTLSDEYADFGTIGAAVLKMLGQIKSIDVGDKDVQDLKSAMSRLPPHPDVRESLQRLKQAGFRMVTLTNNATATAAAQLQHGGIADFFERLFSVDDQARRYKPARECYDGVAGALGVAPAHCLLIACHTWDILGASSAGMQSALIMRAGNAPLAVGQQPDFVGPDLTALVNWLLRRQSPGR
jgi:2-haloacid dehalogenase